MSFLLHLVSSHRSLNSIKQEQVDIIFLTTYEKYCVWCKKQDENRTVPSRHISFPSRHIHILHYFGHFGRYMEIFVLFLITLTIPLMSPRNYSFTTFLTSEKIKEVLSRWKKTIFLISSSHVRNLALKLDKLLTFRVFKCWNVRQYMECLFFRFVCGAHTAFVQPSIYSIAKVVNKTRGTIFIQMNSTFVQTNSTSCPN